MQKTVLFIIFAIFSAFPQVKPSTKSMIYTWNSMAVEWKNKTNDTIIIYTTPNPDSCCVKLESKISEEESYTYKLLSIVGPYVSYELDWHCSTCPPDYWGKKFVTIDLTQKCKIVGLQHFYADTTLFKKVINDAVLKERLKQLDETPTNLKDFLESGFDIGISPTLLNSFAFHHTKTDSVAIRICLNRFPRLGFEEPVQLGIYFKTPDFLREMLNKSDSSGLLMKQFVKKYSNLK